VNVNRFGNKRGGEERRSQKRKVTRLCKRRSRDPQPGGTGSPAKGRFPAREKRWKKAGSGRERYRLTPGSVRECCGEGKVSRGAGKEAQWNAVPRVEKGKEDRFLT